MATKSQILAEIRRTAEANGGTALGKGRFASETGIHEWDWRGRYWARWSDAVAEAGFEPNQLQQRYDEDEVLSKFVGEIRRLGRVPTVAEIILRRREDDTFPSARVFERFGPKAALVEKVREYCRTNGPSHVDVLELLPASAEESEAEIDGSDAHTPDGFVYLLKSGRHYKIGHTLDVGRRRYDIGIQQPEPVTEVHRIPTDDPAGIEDYWHRRFADRRKGGEWFALTRTDVMAFKRRKFM
jgi:hypothetical protein